MIRAIIPLALMLDALTVHAQVEVAGSPVREEVESLRSFSGGMFIMPNESRADAWQPALYGKRGAYISVGTFRGLNTAAYNDFSHVVLVDVDARSVEFNRLNLELIAQSPTRAAYLKYLTGKGATKKQLAQLSPEGQRIYRSFLAGPSDSFGRFRLPIQEEDHTGHLFTRKNTFVSSDKIYAQLRKQILEGRFRALNGSLSGDSTLADLGEAFRKAKVEVSALDISNVLEYLRGETQRAFLRNLERLPFERDGKVLLTSHGASYGNRPGQVGARDPSWDYVVVSPRRVLETDPHGALSGSQLTRRLLSDGMVTLPNGLNVPDSLDCGDKFLKLFRPVSR